MKRLVIALLPLLTLLPAVSPAFAGGLQPNPFQLVNLAYEGHYRSEGVPSHLTLDEQSTEGTIRPKDLISAAVQAGELPAAKLQDESYVNAVRLQMRSLEMDDRNSYW